MTRTASTVLFSTLLLVSALCACTSGTQDAPSTSERRSTAVAAPTPNPAPTGPVGVGPTSATETRACPLVAEQTVADAVGMRLARIQILTSAGRVVGCRFYALQGSPLSVSERLPGPNQPAVEIVLSRYANPTMAHNALARLATVGGNPQQVSIPGTGIGVAFQTRFDPVDGDRDWTCAFSTGSTLAVVHTAVPDTSLDAVTVATSVAGLL